MSLPPISSRSGLALVTVTSLLLCLFFFAPRLWVIASDAEGAPQLVRGRSYLAQCEQPFRSDVEPAMRWRLLPPLVAHGLGLRGKAALILPWLGAIVVTAYVAVLFRRRRPEGKFVFGGVLLFCSTSAILVPVGFIGVNDAWVWLGLLAVAFGRSAAAVPLACLLCPWVDERMIVGYPLAWLIRCLDRREPLLSRSAWLCLWFAPYVALRTASGGAPGADPVSNSFLRAVLLTNIPLIGLLPLAWWVGLRAAWVPVVYAAASIPRERILPAVCILIGTLSATWILASDFSRSIAILVPAALLGCFEFARRHPALASDGLMALGIINLFLPAAHVIYRTIDPINPLPLELYRLLRGQ